MYPVVETIHRDSICVAVMVPARVAYDVAGKVGGEGELWGRVTRGLLWGMGEGGVRDGEEEMGPLLGTEGKDDNSQAVSGFTKKEQLGTGRVSPRVYRFPAISVFENFSAIKSHNSEQMFSCLLISRTSSAHHTQTTVTSLTDSMWIVLEVGSEWVSFYFSWCA